MQESLNTEIKFLPGVGPKRSELLNKELGIYTLRDLLYYFPFRYVDRTKFYKIRELQSDLPYIQLKGKIISYQVTGQGRGQKRLSAKFSDGTGIIELLWFKGFKWIPENHKPNVECIVFGKPSVFRNQINIIHPDIDDISKEKSLSSRLQPMYNTTEKLKNNYITSKVIQKMIFNLLETTAKNLEESLPVWLIKKTGIIHLNEALQTIHFPDNPEILKKAEFRLKFEELFLLQLNILKTKTLRVLKTNGYVFEKVGENFNNFYSNNLPFELTNAQKRVLKEIRRDMGIGKQMNRLLQGDVGSGKTIVALMSMLIAIDNGYQTCLMAPTEILANQHFKSLSGFLEGLNVSIKLLKGSTRKKAREVIHEELLDGSLKILVGTHALIEDIVQFQNLGLVIIDEQHRFGVAQRARLWEKSERPPHVLVMTATPIPRTLAMTVYGDLDVSIIDELPPGRKAIKTILQNDSKRLMLHAFMRKEIEKGRQIYIVYPLIKESEKMDYKDLEDGYFSIVRDFPSPKYYVSVVHGKMKAEEKDISMKHFKEGKTNILVATTVIEVGVDIPNASVMVIESAERFGLSQLHQLRGRVGRGADQSYCILMAGYKLSDEGRKRLEIMVRTNDGFEIAEADLRLRGPGDIEGTQQSGIPFDLKIAHLGRDGNILQYARDIAGEIIDKDPLLAADENRLLKLQLKKLYNKSVNWGEIS
ncbi:MAG: ATP-dependent DNA helicase RecG [Bacteroidales bacterium]|nr:ATP-dependent DNA helicase RecG [Bacteroidales bacterium]MCF8405869.1 ATP-dependent DNA helicase RecG [Bacteroidales bacterium]